MSSEEPAGKLILDKRKHRDPKLAEVTSTDASFADFFLRAVASAAAAYEFCQLAAVSQLERDLCT